MGNRTEGSVLGAWIAGVKFAVTQNFVYIATAIYSRECRKMVTYITLSINLVRSIMPRLNMRNSITEGIIKCARPQRLHDTRLVKQLSDPGPDVRDIYTNTSVLSRAANVNETKSSRALRPHLI